MMIGVFWKVFTLGSVNGVTTPEREFGNAYANWKRQNKPEIFDFSRPRQFTDLGRRNRAREKSAAVSEELREGSVLGCIRYRKRIR